MKLFSDLSSKDAKAIEMRGGWRGCRAHLTLSVHTPGNPRQIR